MLSFTRGWTLSGSDRSNLYPIVLLKTIDQREKKKKVDKTTGILRDQKECVHAQGCSHIGATLTECRAKLVNSLKDKSSLKVTHKSEGKGCKHH